jgi:hypothetical protein
LDAEELAISSDAIQASVGSHRAPIQTELPKSYELAQWPAEPWASSELPDDQAGRRKSSIWTEALAVVGEIGTGSAM